MGRARNWVWVVGSLYCCTSKIVFLAKMNLLRAIARYVVVGWRHFDRFHLSMPKKGEGTLQGLLLLLVHFLNIKDVTYSTNIKDVEFLKGGLIIEEGTVQSTIGVCISRIFNVQETNYYYICMLC